jgi:hypothetical protein
VASKRSSKSKDEDKKYGKRSPKGRQSQPGSAKKPVRVKQTEKPSPKKGTGTIKKPRFVPKKPTASRSPKTTRQPTGRKSNVGKSKSPVRGKQVKKPEKRKSVKAPSKIIAGKKPSNKKKSSPKKPAPKKPAPKKPGKRVGKPVVKPASKRPPIKKPKPAGKRKPARKPGRKVVPPRKPPRKPPKKPGKQPPIKRRRKKRAPKPRPKRRYPSFMAQASEAEIMIQTKLMQLGDLITLSERDLGTDVKTFINQDGTVDGELRLSNLPDEWRTRDGLGAIMATLSEALRGAGAFPAKPSCGGAFWISFGLRFGPKDMTEIQDWAKNYKRFRGLFQIGAHHTNAQNLAAMLNNAVAVRMFIDRVWEKRELPPVQILIRIVWTPTKVQPGRFAGEEGLK